MLHNPQLVHGKAAEMAERWRDKEAAFREERSRVRRELGQKAKAHVGERQATAQVGSCGAHGCCGVLHKTFAARWGAHAAQP